MNKYKCNTCNKTFKMIRTPRKNERCLDCIRKDFKKNGYPCAYCKKKYFMNIETLSKFRYKNQYKEMWTPTMRGPDKDGVPTIHSARRYMGSYRCQNRKVNPDEENITWRIDK